jgi:4-amino-4-deoxy-L-arabinose transferase-like glycosyltransferase
MSHRRRLITVLLLALGALVLYGTRLGGVPMYLSLDESFFALASHSIATTGRDLNDRFLPLYFQWPAEVSTDVFYQPMLVYATALVLKVLPFTETVLRLPAVIVGLADVVLIYFVALRLFKRESLAVVSAVVLLLTPAHFIHSRLAMDYLYPVPFVLAWMLGLLAFLDEGRPWTLFAGTFALGVGFYSYIAAIVMMPVYFAITCGLLLLRRRPLRDFGIALAGFALPLLPIVPWILTHPDAIARTAKRYELYGAAHAAPLLTVRTAFLRSVRESLHFFAITERVSLYWYFFNPAYLFLTGGLFVIGSTRRAGVFLLPLAVFIPVGINYLLNLRRTAAGALLLAGLITAPLAACLVNEPYAVGRELELLPFGVLLAVVGVDAMLSAPSSWRTIVRWTAIVLLILAPLQFAFFWRDYFGRYAVESAGWFGGNVRGGVEDIIEREAAQPHPAIYLSKLLPYVEWTWRVYLIKHRRTNLLERTTYFDAGRVELTTIPKGSLLLVQNSEPASAALLRSDELAKLRMIAQPNGDPFAWVLEKR